MAHLSEETLALLALGESPEPEERAHLDGCGHCAAELAALGHVVRAGRAEPAPVPAPDPRVWAAVHAELGLAPELAADPLAAGDPGTDRAPSAPGASGPAAAGASAAPSGPDGTGRDGTEQDGAEQDGAEQDAGQRPGTAARVDGAGSGGVVDLAARRARRGVPWPLAAAAAAAALVVGGVSVWGAQRLDREPDPTVLATAELEPLAGYTARGSAEVDERADGTRQLVVRTDPADVDGFKEVWLLAPDAQRMVSLGVMAGDEAVFVLPENLDVERFPVVDVSDEPVDGDPTHSGDSIVRGVLAT
ncbi:anti-sigma factor [Kocuria flava]|uniref:anti-sigma factor n=1 Tax=Kocuria flava TaxID=446860 RepID=UPI001FF267BC|nr:anti-sigma factor [Kocuria flava]MCJ8504690.1 anti-sigma factor [Kocuria flava]